MFTIHKFQVQVQEQGIIEVPVGAKLLSIDRQSMYGLDSIQSWWEVDDEEQSTVDEPYLIVGTGHEMPDTRGYQFATSVQQGMFVWHIYMNSDVMERASR
jgi:hypothetical protein